jgi:hypothetical protein
LTSDSVIELCVAFGPLRLECVRRSALQKQKVTTRRRGNLHMNKYALTAAAALFLAATAPAVGL